GDYDRVASRSPLTASRLPQGKSYDFVTYSRSCRTASIRSGIAGGLAGELDTASAVAVLWTRNSVNSLWVKSEAGRALGQRKLVPINADGDLAYSTIPLTFDSLHMDPLVEPIFLESWIHQNVKYSFLEAIMRSTPIMVNEAIVTALIRPKS